jgi:single-strand DNA-binding protein
MNKVIIMGRLTADPELRQTQNGVASCRFTVAVNRRFKNEQGEYEADFLRCTAWKQTAEFISRYFSKGSMISLEGSLRTGSYQDSKHQDVTHYTTEIYVDNAEFCGSKSEGNTNTAAQVQAAKTAVQMAQSAGIQTDLSYSNNNDFEEILSDGEVPF